MGRKQRGAIAAGHPQTAEAGLAILQAGGNAFDAAIAAALAACVTESGLISLAGGGFLLAHTADHRDILFDFFTQTPQRKRPVADLDFYPVTVNFGDAVQQFHVGLGSIAVPGMLKGLLHIHRQLGRLPLAEVVAPAIAYAEAGVTIQAFASYCLQILTPILTATPAGQRIYAPTGHCLQPGDTLRMPEFATTLVKIIHQGDQPLYAGEWAKALVDACEHGGGHLTQADLAAYQVIERQPLTLSYRGNTILTNPPPSAGGVLIGFALKLLEAIELSRVTFGGDEHLRILRQVMQLTNAARRDRYDNRLDPQTLLTTFLSPDTLQPYQAALRATGAGHPAGGNKWGSTTHISVIDAEGNAASMTASNGEGSTFLIPGTGMMVNNMLGEADLNPDGFHTWQPNQRLASMMAPTIVLKAGQPELVLGSGGSNRIRTAILQVMLNILDFQMPLEQAIASPRLHWEDQVLNLEPGLPGAEAIQYLAAKEDDRVLPWQAQNMFFGGVHAISRQPDGTLAAGGDRRRDGVGIVWD
ncbi:gamma-glutamyltransferase [Trichothermofontia sp.]